MKPFRHLTDEEIEAIHAGELSNVSLFMVRLHLFFCRRCREKIQYETGMERFIRLAAKTEDKFCPACEGFIVTWQNYCMRCGAKNLYFNRGEYLREYGRAIEAQLVLCETTEPHEFDPEFPEYRFCPDCGEELKS